MIDRDNFFKKDSDPGRRSNPDQLAAIENTAKSILSAEAFARAEKTAHLRRLRLGINGSEADGD